MTIEPREAAQRVSHSPAVHKRGWVEVRWRQFRRAPKPIVRAVASSLGVALGLGALYLVYDVAITRGARLPGGDLRVLAAAAYVGLVLGAGAVLTYLVVPQPTGAGPRDRFIRSRWSAALGFFAALPIAYLVLVLVAQVLKPLFA
jgi:hypothetical protein